MPTGPMNRLVDHLRRVAVQAGGEWLTDGELLERFIVEQDEAAFEALLRRHAPMVLGVCRRLLGHVHDAEDAFQATFLVLVRRAGSIRPREAVGNWLYGVAYRTALEARVRLARRRAREHQVAIMPQREIPPESSWHDVRPVLDHELSALPEKYRLPVVLCDLEGRGRRDVARQLCIPEGTLSSRLATARKMLAARLARRGVMLSAVGLAVLLCQNGVSACVPASLCLSTTRAALLLAAGPAVAAGLVPAKVAALSEGVLKMMFLAKLKMTAIVCVGVAAVGLGTGGLIYQARAGGDPVQSQHASQQRVQRQARADHDDDKPAQRRHDDQKSSQDQQLRREAERARAEADAARREADQVRREVEQALRQARSEIDRARKEAREQIDRARAAEQQARRSAARSLYAHSAKEAKQQLDRHDTPKLKHDKQSQADHQEHARQQWLDSFARGNREMTAGLERARKQMMENFERQRKQLQEQMRHLDEMQKQALRQLDQQRSRAQQRGVERPNRRQGAASANSGDKLDRILERLDRMERRLDRLEHGNRTSGGRE